MVDDPERDTLDPFDQIVDGLGRPVRHTGGVPGADLVFPAEQGPAELVGFDRQVGVLEIVAEPIDELERQVLIPVLVDAADDLSLAEFESIFGALLK